MSQLTYDTDMDEAFVGMKADAGFDDVISLQATEVIKYGLGVVKNIGSDNQGRLPAANQGSLVFDADFVTDNDIDMDINGVAITTVEFDTNHDTTIAALAVEIAANDSVYSAVLDTTDTDSRTIIVTSVDGTDMLIDSIAVTNGGTQAGGTFTQGTRDVLAGMSLATQAKEQALSTGIVQYMSTEPVSVGNEGRGWAYAEEAVTSDDPVYCRFLANGTGKDPGQFRKDSDSGKAVLVTRAKFVSTATAAGPVKIEFDRI